MQILPGLKRCEVGTCELCRGFFHQGGVTGFVKNRSVDGGMRSRHVSICNECLKQGGDAEVPEQTAFDKVLEDCLAPLKGLGKLEQVELDGGEIKPSDIKPEDWLKFGEDGYPVLKGTIKITALDVNPIQSHLYNDDELKSKVEQLQLLRDIEKEARLNAEALKQQFERDPLLLKVYLPSADYVVEKVGKAVDDLIGGLL